MAATDKAASPTAMRDVYTVSRLNLEVRALLDSSFPPIWVEGELSNLARPRSGHMYFSLKDDNCQVRCAMFRMHNRSLDFAPENGQQVLARASVGLYPERGDYQLVVQHMEEAGAGALRRAFEALKARLEKEGLFAAEHKRALPEIPTKIGVITSPTGAAIRDILTVLERRYPIAPVLVYPVPVQGQGAADKIAAALDRANARNDCDVLILARGGGSLEDLWAFNEEPVARAIHRCEIPVVTGIGHEIDFSIADFVADQRAATPSAAAELVSPNVAEWSTWLAQLSERLERLCRQHLHRAAERLHMLGKRLVHPRRRLFDASQKLDGLNGRLHRAQALFMRQHQARLRMLEARLATQAPARRLRHHRENLNARTQRLERASHRFLRQLREQLAHLERTLVATGPAQTLNRGYAIVVRDEDGTVVRDAADVRVGETVSARVASGSLSARVTATEDGDST